MLYDAPKLLSAEIVAAGKGMFSFHKFQKRGVKKKGLSMISSLESWCIEFLPQLKLDLTIACHIGMQNPPPMYFPLTQMHKRKKKQYWESIVIYVWLPILVSFQTVSTYDIINIQVSLLIFLPRIITFLLDRILICLRV